jgi:hypothetical protein
MLRIKVLGRSFSLQREETVEFVSSLKIRTPLT